MRRARTALVLAALLCTVTTASAAPCTTQGSKDAKELTLNFKDEKTMKGLFVSFQLGLTPPEFPAEDIKKIQAPCSRGSIPDYPQVELFGDNENTPPRWAKTPASDSPVFYLALMPRPEPARVWYETTKPQGSVNVGFKDGEWMRALVVTNGDDNRIVFAFFDEVPDDERLKALIQTIASRKARWQVGYNVKTLDVTPNTAP
jgi:hypothetical protein